MSSKEYRDDEFSPDSFFPSKAPSGPLIFNNNPSYSTPSLDTYTKPPRPHRQKPAAQSVTKITPTDSKRSSATHGPNSRHRRERERALADIPTDTLIQLVINEEFEAQETRKVLSTTMAQLEASTRKAEQAEARGRMLEDEREAQALKITQAILDAQRDAAKAKEDVAVYQLKLAHAEQEIQRAKEVVQAVEGERDDAERAAVKARKVARELKERTVVQLAREEGRRAGFEEGIRQGRLLATVDIVEQARPVPQRLLGDGTAFIEEESPEDQARSPTSDNNHRSRRRRNGGRSAHATPRGRLHSLDTSVTTSRRTSATNTPTSAISLEAEAAAAALRQIEEREKERVQIQVRMLERDLEFEREKAKEYERERERERQREAERLRELEREKDRVREREHARLRELEAERDREREAAAREREREQRLRAKERENEERSRENERKQIERQKRELERERDEREKEKERLKEAERQLERERERDKELDRERERELERERLRLRAQAAAISAAAESDSDLDDPRSMTPRAQPASQLQYLPMPPPPVIPSMPATDTPLPVRHIPFGQRASSGSSSQDRDRRAHRRRTSLDSGSSTSSMTQFDILTFPNPREEKERERERKLSVIPEVASVRDSPNTDSEPSWVRNPPVDHSRVPYAVAAGGPDVGNWRNSIHGGSHYQPAYRSEEQRGRPGHPQFDNSLLTPRSDRPLSARSSSTGTYDITVEPPSPPVNRPSSQPAVHEPEPNQNLNYLSPNHRPAPLPTSGRQTPVRPPTQPNSPALDASGLPPGFVPLAFTSPQGGAGGGGGVSPIYGPPRPLSANQNGNGGQPKPSIYGNPSRENSEESPQSSFGVAPPPPSFTFTPRSTQGFLPVIPDSAGGSRPSNVGPGMTPRAGTNGLPGGSTSGIYGRPTEGQSHETPRQQGGGGLPGIYGRPTEGQSYETPRQQGGGGLPGIYGRPSEGQTYDAIAKQGAASGARSFIAHMPDPVIPSAETLRGTPRQKQVSAPAMTPRAGTNNLPGGSGSGIYGRPSEGYDGTPRQQGGVTMPGGLTPLSGTHGLPGIYGRPNEGQTYDGGTTPRSSAQGLPGSGIYGRPNDGAKQGMTPHSGTRGLPGAGGGGGIYGRPPTDPSRTPRQGTSAFPEADVDDSNGQWGNNGDDDGFDTTTHQNTFLNSGVGSSVDNKPAAPAKGKKKKGR